jgi:exodeoxyribonuclease VII large subunit
MGDYLLDALEDIGESNCGRYGQRFPARTAIGYNRAMPKPVNTLPKAPPAPAEIWTVSQITRKVKGLLESEIGSVWVSGEISNWRVSPAGHAYFTLKDEWSQLSAVIFRGKLNKLRFEPEGGLEVIVRGMVSVYEQRGAYQILCDDIQPKGVGALQLAFEKLKKKLEAEGIFDESLKKGLPVLPRRIGVVTSPTGAAVRDILNVLARRFARAHIILYPARVQGDEAAPEIVEGIEALDAWGVDVMIVGRGGGSLEDLWPFNEEAVVRAIHAAQTPVISAVGHEIDFTLSDFAADLRAPTPSAAAELVVQEYESLADTVDGLRQRMAAAASRCVERARTHLERQQASFVFSRPEEMTRQRRQRCDELRLSLDRALSGRVEQARHRVQKATEKIRLLSPANQIRRATLSLASLRARLNQSGLATVQRARGRFQPMVAQLDALSPLAILSRGYALGWKLPEDVLIRDAGMLQPKDQVRLRFGEGSATAIVESVEKDEA